MSNSMLAESARMSLWTTSLPTASPAASGSERHPHPVHDLAGIDRDNQPSSRNSLGARSSETTPFILEKTNTLSTRAEKGLFNVAESSYRGDATAASTTVSRPGLKRAE